VDVCAYCGEFDCVCEACPHCGEFDCVYPCGLCSGEHNMADCPMRCDCADHCDCEEGLCDWSEPHLPEDHEICAECNRRHIYEACPPKEAKRLAYEAKMGQPCCYWHYKYLGVLTSHDGNVCHVDWTLICEDDDDENSLIKACGQRGHVKDDCPRHDLLYDENDDDHW